MKMSLSKQSNSTKSVKMSFSEQFYTMSGLCEDTLVCIGKLPNGDIKYKRVRVLRKGNRVYDPLKNKYYTIKFVVRMRVNRDIIMYDINGATMTGNSIVETEVPVLIPDTYLSKGGKTILSKGGIVYTKGWANVKDLSNAIPNDEQVDYIYNFVMENSEYYLPLANGMKFATLGHCIKYKDLMDHLFGSYSYATKECLIYHFFGCYSYDEAKKSPIDYFFGCRKVVDALEIYLNMRKDILGIDIDVIIDLRHNDFVTECVYNEQYQAYEIHVVLDISNIINTRWLIR
jgi:hypothetical protein